MIESARSLARPAVATEALGRPDHGELYEILPLFTKSRIGWYLWELKHLSRVSRRRKGGAGASLGAALSRVGREL